MPARVLERAVQIPVHPGITLEGTLALPDGCRLVVVFAHGSGSSRFSPRNQHVAATLVDGGLGTLLFDLLTPAEEREDDATARLRFDIPMLAERIVAVTDWLLDQPATVNLPVGYFGASTGAGAALVAAAKRPERVAAVVSRGGRPDLAGEYLERVVAPTLLIVGGRDLPVLDLNERALQRLPEDAELAIVPGATHLFEEPGTLDRAARLAFEWFRRAAEA